MFDLWTLCTQMPKSKHLDSKNNHLVFWARVVKIVVFVSNFGCKFVWLGNFGHPCVHLLFGGLFRYGYLRIDNAHGMVGE
jgi:hypothetical protein